MSGIFSDTFDVLGVDVDPGSENKQKKKMFDKVSRLVAKSENYDTELTLDVNSDIYSVSEGDKIELLLSENLREGGDGEDGGYDPTVPLGERADHFDYVMFGRIYKFAEEKSRAVIYMSFGGLLLSLRGEARILTSHTYKVDAEVYLFLKKI